MVFTRFDVIILLEMVTIVWVVIISAVWEVADVMGTWVQYVEEADAPCVTIISLCEVLISYGRSAPIS